MSRPETSDIAISLGDLPAPICAYCGERITEDDQQCAALDDGRCMA